MKVLSHSHWQTLIMLFCIFLVLPCLWFLHAIFQNWVEYLSRCKKEKLLQRLTKLRRGEKTEKLIVSSASTFSYFCHHFENLVSHHTPQSTAVCLQMQFCDKDKLLSLNKPSLQGQSDSVKKNGVVVNFRRTVSKQHQHWKNELTKSRRAGNCARFFKHNQFTFILSKYILKKWHCNNTIN